MQNNIYKTEADFMLQNLQKTILQKQKATMSIALSLANCKNTIDLFERGVASEDSYKNLIGAFKRYTLYKNVWIQLIDKNGNSFYRSWSRVRENLLSSRKGLTEIIHSPKPICAISVGKFDLSLKNMVPIYKDKNFLGVLEVITHFNSIAAVLQKYQIESIVVLDKKYNKQLLHPFSKIFLDGHYIANKNISKESINYFKTKKLEEYFTSEYKIKDAYLIVSYPLKNSLTNESIGHYVMYKKLSDIKQIHVNNFILKATIIFIFILVLLVGSVMFYGYLKNKKQKYYYKNIIDTSNNILIVNDGIQMIDANKRLFNYLYKYKNLEEFTKEHSCICDYFVKDEGYLKSEMNGLEWTEYIYKNRSQTHKAKLKYDDKIYFFLVAVSKISKEKNHYSVVLTDITKEEEYQKILHESSIRDPLTNLYNRRFLTQKLLEEAKLSQRYGYPLSLIMCDIDFFKKVNDTYGHAMGDDVLVSYTKLITDSLREIDIFSRVGGEEFIIILHETKYEDALNVAENLRQRVENKKDPLAITMSFGVTSYRDNEDINILLERVDEALYKAKESGRNRVVGV